MTSSSSPSQLRREWALCAIAAAGARFIPVPLADDLVRDRAVRTAVSRTWRAHGRPPAPAVVDALCGDTTGTLTSLRGYLARVPLRIAMFPFRTVRLLFTAVQGVSEDLLQVLLLSRSVDRCLGAGWFDVDDEREQIRRARLIRRAHDQAVRGADLHTLRLALGSAFRTAGGLSRQAPDFAREVFGRARRISDGGSPVTGSGSATQQIQAEQLRAEQLRAGAERLEAVLERPESARILAELDARFDAALAAIIPAGPVPAKTGTATGPSGTVPGAAPSGTVPGITLPSAGAD